MIYVRAVLDLLRSGLPVRGLAHITGGGLTNLRRLAPGRAGYAIEEPLAPPAVFGLIAELGDVPEPPRCGRSSTWAAGSWRSCPRHTRARRRRSSPRATPAARRIGTVTDRADETLAPGGLVVG